MGQRSPIAGSPRRALLSRRRRAMVRLDIARAAKQRSRQVKTPAHATEDGTSASGAVDSISEPCIDVSSEQPLGEDAEHDLKPAEDEAAVGDEVGETIDSEDDQRQQRQVQQRWR